MCSSRVPVRVNLHVAERHWRGCHVVDGRTVAFGRRWPMWWRLAAAAAAALAAGVFVGVYTAPDHAASVKRPARAVAATPAPGFAAPLAAPAPAAAEPVTSPAAQTGVLAAAATRSPTPRADRHPTRPAVVPHATSASPHATPGTTPPSTRPTTPPPAVVPLCRPAGTAPSAAEAPDPGLTIQLVL